MSTVWKYVLRPDSQPTMPVGSTPLFVAEQNGEVCLWARVYPERPQVKRIITVVGTGHDAPSDQVYVGSAMLAGGTFVFHVFDGGDA